MIVVLLTTAGDILPAEKFALDGIFRPPNLNVSYFDQRCPSRLAGLNV
jgi:hypothetical protein